MSGKWEVRSQNVKFKTVGFFFPFFFLSFLKKGEWNRGTHSEAASTSQCVNIGGAELRRSHQPKRVFAAWEFALAMVCGEQLLSAWPGQRVRSLCGPAAMNANTLRGRHASE